MQQERAWRKPMRADAARNIEKVITAALDCFREDGPNVSLKTVADRAGVGPATLFRNFADKDELVLAAVERQLKVKVDPVAEMALENPDAAAGLVEVLSAVMQVANDEYNLLSAVAGRRGLLLGLAGKLIESLGLLLQRGQQQGTLREELQLVDMVRLVAMLIGAGDTVEPGSFAWQRYVALVEDAIRTHRENRPLPPLEPIPGVELPV
ncbi:TetR/AcrR family transcriptional regulator [Sinomonas sp. ASV486]|uniref:TetR/AcrR family transcriptional regulator n=1 Tax=Sinomonas puerhi TaxID=3238584 RepID=A0AB39L3R1_9MICC|nr:TetR/AcrR family transcriptional regulator [Sinomonas sp. ASV486]MDQ4490207.1 TetR/AcrR family transcriptional regulator [Sinomonas sp. ASV486]